MEALEAGVWGRNLVKVLPQLAHAKNSRDQVDQQSSENGCDLNPPASNKTSGDCPAPSPLDLRQIKSASAIETLFP
jgi:hypothetical protein